MNSTNSFLEKPYGYVYSDQKITVFFGNAHLNLDQLDSLFSNTKFLKIKQTHSDLVVNANDIIQEADAHWTKKKKLALLISTADCLPILIHCSKTNMICSVHAGWKGVVNQIVLKSLDEFKKNGSDLTQMSFYLGPHIHTSSFEVSKDVFDQLTKSGFNLENKDQYYFQISAEKYLVNLKEILLTQINYLLKNKPFSLNELPIDTMKNGNFWSYRRDKEKAGRNLSFIMLN